MFDLQIQSELDKFNIETIKDNSGHGINRVLIIFKNGYELSVIRGRGTYGNEAGLFEIAVYDRNGNFCGNQLFDWGDDVSGWNTADDVREYMLKIGNLPE